MPRRWRWPTTAADRPSSRTASRQFVADMVDGLRKDVGHHPAHPDHALRAGRRVHRRLRRHRGGHLDPELLREPAGPQQQASAIGVFAVLAIFGGIPGTLIGGRMADRWVNQFMGARVVIPAVCIFISAALFMVSFIPMPFAAVFVLQLLGFMAATACVPAACGPGCPTPRRPRCAGRASVPSTWPRWSSGRPPRRWSPRWWRQLRQQLPHRLPHPDAHRLPRRRLLAAGPQAHRVAMRPRSSKRWCWPWRPTRPKRRPTPPRRPGPAITTPVPPATVRATRSPRGARPCPSTSAKAWRSPASTTL